MLDSSLTSILATTHLPQLLIVTSSFLVVFEWLGCRQYSGFHIPPPGFLELRLQLRRGASPRKSSHSAQTGCCLLLGARLLWVMGLVTALRLVLLSYPSSWISKAPPVVERRRATHVNPPTQHKLAAAARLLGQPTVQCPNKRHSLSLLAGGVCGQTP